MTESCELSQLQSCRRWVIVVCLSRAEDKAKPWRRILDESLSSSWPVASLATVLPRRPSPARAWSRVQDRAKDDAFLSLFFQEFQGFWLWVKRDLDSWRIGEAFPPSEALNDFMAFDSVGFDSMSARRVPGGILSEALRIPSASAES